MAAQSPKIPKPVRLNSPLTELVKDMMSDEIGLSKDAEIRIRFFLTEIAKIPKFELVFDVAERMGYVIPYDENGKTVLIKPKVDVLEQAAGFAGITEYKLKFADHKDLSGGLKQFFERKRK